MARNYFADPMQTGEEAFDRAFDRQQGITNRITTTRAGRQLASGDRAGAGRTFAGAGMINEARVLEGDQVAADNRMRAEQDRTQAAEMAAAAKRAETAAAVFGRLQTVQMGKRAATIQRAAPLLQAVGIDPSPFLAMPEEAFSDEELAMAVGQVKRDLEFVKGSGGGWQALDKGTANVVASGMAPQPAEIKQFDPDMNVVEIPATPGTNSAPGGIAAPLRDLEAMGVRVTSDVRTTERNRQVGGVPNSRHMSGEALDLVPPQGMTMAQLAQETKRRFPQARVINEGDHVHVEWGAQRANPFPNAPRVLQQAAPKERDAPSGWEWNGGRLQPIPGGPADPAVKGVPDPKAQRKAATDLRKEFNARPEVKEFRDVQTSYNQIRGLLAGPASAAADIAGIFSYMKMLDPGSVVREGEFANAQNAAGIPDRIRNIYNNALNGQRLNARQRQDFLAQAENIYRTRGQRYAQIVGEYRGYARDYDIDPDQVARPMDSASGSQKRYPDAVNRAHAEAVRKGEYDASAPLGSRRRPFLAASEADVRAVDTPANRGKFIRMPDGSLGVID